ncbi:flavodoxin-dependent (E)-4-hydroxy-3-methylbut-2-enyl-diphosphate synthase [Collinsella sp. zg1085]|uniref:flavodoxin-dependent (E)-4-hydroxy-3-methylbut-2-enyl-diphosphate synthase n=1 Tax=Collinsella sp. zg1085 TaxID=2844380 RepID=UPI001C0BD6B9|nr:flavodoxin-dependent (E)-4-hydroxy-3-methylbut-2-enyl-diphosphate synthase [Collinsella sp. zg1085]QWT17029.1 flavodoxin-dependent (E)-4-hydroxy-3-methylbut-2-enyl-diphosphate synthase [Collinsella sp. zg1085]
MTTASHIPRIHTRAVPVGSITIGGGAPVAVQSMTTTDTANLVETLKQVRALAHAGCDVVRVSVPHKKCLAAFRELCQVSPVPIIADIHFDYRLAVSAAQAGAAKLRINPGNIGSWDKVDAVIDAAGEAGCAIRIGVNAGSLPQSIAERQDISQSEKLTLSALSCVEHFEQRGFQSIVLSAKAHSVLTTLDTYRRLSQELPEIPLHLGVTEAGGIRSGTIKSSIALGALLAEGIGDTLRVSLTADPLEEVPVAWGILAAVGVRRRGPEMISCPTCARCQVDMIPIAQEVERRLEQSNKPLSVAVMGCAVNGPGEASEADVGIACGSGQALLFRSGKVIAKVSEDNLVERLMAEIEQM